jgi:hypothetical protein
VLLSRGHALDRWIIRIISARPLILKEGEAGVPIADLVRKHWISGPTYFNWRANCGGMKSSELKRIRELGAENSKLKTHECGPSA